MQESVVKFKGIPVVLDGKQYIMPPLALGALEQLLPGIQQFKSSSDMQLSDVSVVVDAVHASLKRNYPEMERTFVADNIDLGNMQEMMENAMDVSGMKRKRTDAAAGGA